jgi:hypothetical protein
LVSLISTHFKVLFKKLILVFSNLNLKLLILASGIYGIPLASEIANYVVKKFMSHYVAAYRLMWALYSNNARNLDGAFMRQITSLLGVIKTSTPPHNPQSNLPETMCGAIAMLIRKGLQDSDRRYFLLTLLLQRKPYLCLYCNFL